MKNIKSSPNFIFVILFYLNILDQSNMEVIPNGLCESDDMEGLIRWYSDVYKFVKSNKDLNKRLNELESEMKVLNRKLEEQNEIVIQRRMDGSENFYRNWEDYKHGFGNRNGEFFIGLQRLHKLTNSRPYELLVVLEDFDDDRRYAKYDNFVIASEKENYKLQSLGQYNGTAGDSLTYHLGYNFTTKDRDNDIDNNNCAQIFTGAWWYKNCHASNLNGSYLRGTTTAYAKGVVWNSYRGHYYSLKFVEMSIRPK
ncbi:fibrinogen C domain-containing protein 1 isoform X1 [Musca domestica]|uniref:Fibrinogen C domain-containing protein 1 isoform X1 n=3 Tax=Musca domestica TaxID=7370 RepID=A0A1I8M228_MUSDO|nr:fibrinogen C domain-containing protein 1 isoform X1 [Musca domestica]